MPSPFRRFLRTFPTGRPLVVLLAAILALLVPIILLEWPVLQHTHGDVIFPTDSAFLDLSVARTFSFYQVWGISKHAFQSASSSLLYPLVLTPVFFIAGAHLLIPLVINFLAGVYFLVALQRVLIRQGLRPAQQLFLLLAAMALTLLPLLVVSGMEYALQLLLVFLFLESLAETLSNPGLKPTTNTAPAPAGPPLPRQVYGYGLLIVATRYEDLIIIALACVLLTPLRGWKTALRLAAVSIVPVILFGIISLSKGSYFLPNSLLLGPYPAWAFVLALLAGCAAIPFFASWFRLPAVEKARAVPFLSLVLLAILALPFAARNLSALGHFRRDCIRMYDQEYLTAGFVRRYYFESAVGIDQPGAVSWFSEGRLLDFTGVANGEITRSKEHKDWSPLYADSLGRRDGIRAAIVTDPWFNPDQLPKWNIIATWKIPDTSPDRGPAKVISFYAVNKYDTASLRRNLLEYQRLLPADVAVQYY